MKKKLLGIIVVLVIVLNVLISVTPNVTGSKDVTLRLVEARADGSAEAEEDDDFGEDPVAIGCVDTGNFFTDIIDFIFGSEK